MYLNISFLRALLLLSAWLAVSPAQLSWLAAQENDLASKLESLKTQLAAASDLDESTRQQIAGSLGNADADLTAVAELEQRIESERRMAENAEDDSGQAVELLRKLRDAKSEPLDQSLEMDQLESRSAELRRELEQSKTELKKLEQELSGRVGRKAELTQLLPKIEEQIVKLEQDQQLLPELDGSLKAEARRIELSASLAKNQASGKAAEAELRRIEAQERHSTIRNRRDLVAAETERLKKQIEAIDSVVAEQRKKIAQQTAESARRQQRQLLEQFPQLGPSIEFNLDLAKRLQEIETEANKAKKRSDNLKSQYEQLARLFTETRQLEASYRPAGLTGSSGPVGAMLRKRRSDLPDQNKANVDSDAIRDRIEEVQFESLDIEQQLDGLDSDRIKQEVAAASGQLYEATWEELQQPMEQLASARKKNLESLSGSINRLFNDLLATESHGRNISRLSSEFEDFINERILWIQSNRVLLTELKFDENEIEVAKGKNWADAFHKIWRSIQQAPVLFALTALVVVLLIANKNRMRREVDRMGEIAARGSCDTFWPTSRSLFLTILIAVATPLIPLGLGWVLGRTPPTENILFNSLAPALFAAGLFALPIEVLRRLCRADGLAARHYDWPEIAVTCIRKNLSWFVLPASLIVFAIALLNSMATVHRVDLVERLLFVAGMVMLTFLLFRLLHPQSGIFSLYLSERERSWANQTSALWFGLILVIPISLATLTFFGYYYTALNLAKCVFATFVFAIAAEVVRALIKRFVLVRRRHAHIQTARQKREAQLQAKRDELRKRAEALRLEAGTDSQKSTDAESAAAATLTASESLSEMQLDIDIDQNAIETNKLVDMAMFFVWIAAIWMIWIDVLPAMKALDNYTVWSLEGVEVTASEPADGVNPAADPTGMALLASEAGSSNASASSRVTIRDVLVFLLIAAITLVSATNLPNAIEMLFLDHLPVDRSARYATKALFSYAIVMLGMILAFRTLSISWNNVQWLATALTFGLAFGLQEIFANFVAGIILMFERPIRIGDWITVDEFTGMVTRIRTRATTIVNFDRKEYVIPNKDFITGRLVNWTLSDAINRITFTVGIAYGSNVEKAKQIIYEICREHPRIVADPPTVVTFEEFGDSSLNLVLRTFVNEIDARLPVIDGLHSQIDQEFRKAGIEISFPQRDLHVRSVDPTAAEQLGKRSS